MPYAVLQKELDAPSAEQLRRAFRALPELTDGDGASMSRDAFGILVDGLSLENATILQRALQAEGVETELVDQEDLIPLPPAKRLQRADPAPEGLIVHSHLGPQPPTDWSHVILVAAGRVRLTQFRRTERERIVYRRVGRAGAFPIYLTDVSHKEERNFKLVVEILLDIAPARYQITADRFRYNYLGPRLQTDWTQNYASLVRDIVRYAARATINRGAQSLRKDPNAIFQYPTRHAFEEEIVWLLWRWQKAASGEA